MCSNRVLRCILLAGGVFLSLGVHAQEFKDSVTVYFRLGKSELDLQYRQNSVRLEEFDARVNRMLEDSTFIIKETNYKVSSSPDGSILTNIRLTRARAASVTEFLKSRYSMEETSFRTHSLDEDWPELRKMVAEGSAFAHSDEALATIEGIIDGTATKSDLMQLRGGQPWAYMLQHYFPSLRRFVIIVTVGVRMQDVDVEDDGLEEVQDSLSAVQDSLGRDILEVEVLEKPEPEPEPQPQPEESKWVRKFTLKTNMAAWALAITNLAFEVDIVENFSFHLPVYYSGYDYFKNTIKFRILALQPEFRYYIPKVEGLFLGAHFTMAYFNFATNGDYRIQDHRGRTPMLGGGVSLGYRLHFAKHPRWGMEFALGAGAYRFDYDRYVNEKNGPFVNTVNKTYIGPDNVAISFTYDFDLVKKSAKNREGSK